MELRSFKEMEAIWRPTIVNMTLVGSHFDTLFKSEATPFDMEWSTFVEYHTEGHQTTTTHKNELALINFVEYKEKRLKVDAIRMNALFIDYDKDMTIAEAKRRFKNVEYLLYTSYNHQRNKYNDDGSIKDTPRDKFRMIFPFKESCPAAVWETINQHVMTFAPKCDPASKKITQCFTGNYTHPDYIDRAVVLHNKGKVLDWKTWDKNPVEVDWKKHNGANTGSQLDEEDMFPPEQVFKLKNGGMVKAEDITKKISDVYCPFHADKSPGTFLAVSKAGTPFHVCDTCEKTRWMRRPEKASVEDLTTGFKKRSHKRKIDNTPIIDMPYEDAWTREERWTKLKKSIWEYKTGTHLILAGEGYGKSYLAVKWAQAGRKILFTSLSNEQAEEQADSFRAVGLRVQLLTGTEYNLNKLGIEVERYPHINPWQIGNINEPATVVRIMIKYACDEEEAQGIFDMNKPRMPRFNDVDIVVTTHARLTGWGAMNNKIGDTEAPMVPRYVTIVIDDPSANQFKRLTPYDERFVNCKIDGNEIEQAEYDNYHYFVKPDKYTLGYGFPYHMKVFTTTELLISNLMETVYPDLILHDMLQKRVFSGNITMFKTKLVYSKFDAVIPLLVNRLERRTRSDIVYIANGQGMEHNLINTKGQNKFSEKHIIIEISEAPLNVIHQWCHELDWDINDTECCTVLFVKYIIAMDEMQQAIGRNRGYRWKDRIDSGDDSQYAMVVLVAPSLVEQLVHASRYHFTEVKDLEPLTGTGKMPEAWSVAGGIEWLINNVGRYMDVGVSAKQRKDRPDIQSDIKAVFEKLKGRGKHIQFFRRLEKLSEYLKDYKFDKPLFNLIPKKLNEIGKKLENLLRELE